MEEQNNVNGERGEVVMGFWEVVMDVLMGMQVEGVEKKLAETV